LLSCWLGDDAVREARATFRAAGVADYDTPEEAVRAFSLLQQWRKLRDLLETGAQRTAATPPLDFSAVRAIVDRALQDGREWLLEDEAKAALAAAGIPTVATRHAEPNAEAAIEAAREIGFPVVLKILSPDLLHKSDLGGVALDLGDEEELRIAANAMLLRLKKSRPDARLVGFSVQTMVRARGAVELILGASIDPTFGPVLLFGPGGTAVELLEDRALARRRLLIRLGPTAHEVLLPLGFPLGRPQGGSRALELGSSTLESGRRGRPPILHLGLLGAHGVHRLLEGRLGELCSAPKLGSRTRRTRRRLRLPLAL
jgi:acetyltransferase